MADLFRGCVRDTGGGVVTIVVHPDTMDYPEEGQLVAVSAEPAKVISYADGQCANCLRIDQPTELVRAGDLYIRLCRPEEGIADPGCAGALEHGMLWLLALYASTSRPEPGTPYPRPARAVIEGTSG